MMTIMCITRNLLRVDWTLAWRLAMGHRRLHKTHMMGNGGSSGIAATAGMDLMVPVTFPPAPVVHLSNARRALWCA